MINVHTKYQHSPALIQSWNHPPAERRRGGADKACPGLHMHAIYPHSGTFISCLNVISTLTRLFQSLIDTAELALPPSDRSSSPKQLFIHFEAGYEIIDTII